MTPRHIVIMTSQIKKGRKTQTKHLYPYVKKKLLILLNKQFKKSADEKFLSAGS